MTPYNGCRLKCLEELNGTSCEVGIGRFLRVTSTHHDYCDMGGPFDQ